MSQDSPQHPDPREPGPQRPPPDPWGGDPSLGRPVSYDAEKVEKNVRGQDGERPKGSRGQGFHIIVRGTEVIVRKSAAEDNAESDAR